MSRASVLFLVIVFCCPMAVATGAEAPPATQPSGDVMPLVERMPADPLMVVATSGRPLGELLDESIAYGTRIDPAAKEKVDAFLADASQKAGCDVRADLLAHFGPRIAWVIDAPAIDSIAGAFAGGDPAAGLAHALGRVAALVDVREAGTVLSCLERVLRADGESVQVEQIEDGLVRVQVSSADGGAGAPAISLFYGAADGLFALGFDRAFVHGLLHPSADRPALASGADFTDVFSHLDAKPAALSYVNLPKLHRMIGESEVLRGVIASDESARPLFDALLDPDVAAGGVGATSVRADGGWRTTTFSRSSLIGPFGYSGKLLTAIALPNLLQAIERGRQQRTTRTISDIAVAVDAYGEENGRYPVLGDDWQPVEKLAPALEGVYLEKLVTEDAWGHPLLYWSDGQHYRVISTGRDGKVDRDWRAVTEPVAVETPDNDIVFEERGFLAMPEMDDGD
ncbi:MAG: hypothetical protein D6738_04745 [Acidobacteria bacterium]|nr:MAG: hypothetical protein D6738_04745 [Acidobacteriota bacterium]